MQKQVSYTVLTLALIGAVIVGAAASWFFIWANPSTFIGSPLSASSTTQTITAATPTENQAVLVGTATAKDSLGINKIPIASRVIDGLRLINATNNAYADFGVIVVYGRSAPGALIVTAVWTLNVSIPDIEVFQSGVTLENVQEIFGDSLAAVEAKILNQTGASELFYAQSFYDSIFFSSNQDVAPNKYCDDKNDASCFWDEWSKRMGGGQSFFESFGDAWGSFLDMIRDWLGGGDD